MLAYTGLHTLILILYITHLNSECFWFSGVYRLVNWIWFLLHACFCYLYYFF